MRGERENRGTGEFENMEIGKIKGKKRKTTEKKGEGIKKKTSDKLTDWRRGKVQGNEEEKKTVKQGKEKDDNEKIGEKKRRKNLRGRKRKLK